MTRLFPSVPAFLGCFFSAQIVRVTKTGYKRNFEEGSNVRKALTAKA
jgi:hypothetical protein